MPKRSRIPDPNQLAASIVRQVTQAASDQPKKNPAAVALGRLGGLKGGKVRFQRLTPAQRRKIAKMGARTRWKKKASHVPGT